LLLCAEWGLWQTAFGILGLSDMELPNPLDWKAKKDELIYSQGAIVVFFLYIFLTQIVLVNLLSE
jgi:hypothetical protein